MDNPKELKEYIQKLKTERAINKSRLEEVKKKLDQNNINIAIIQSQLDELNQQFDQIEKENMEYYGECEKIIGVA